MSNRSEDAWIERDRVGELLDNVLTRTVEWVKYAEAKNGVLLTVNAGAAAATIGWMSAGDGPPVWLRLPLLVGLALITASIVIALTSFLPVLHIDFLKLKRKHGRVDSVLYFGSIAGCSGESYLQSVLQALNSPPESAGRLERDYANQIVVNSQIATAKFRMFRYAGWLCLSAILVPSLRIVFRLGF